jgi:betaine-aldehyde dehydrogenase
MQSYRNYIDGKFVDAASGKTYAVIDPATREVIAEVPQSDPEDIDRAVAAARRAFDSDGWPDTSARDRGRILFRIADYIRQNARKLAELETLNNGKPIAEAEGDISDAAYCFEYYGGLATKIHGEVLTVPDNAMAMTLREPVGVAGLIVPWNYPMMMAVQKVAPAIAAGCTSILKPARPTPLSMLELAKCFNEVGLPAGVVNVLSGPGGRIGSAMVKHPGVDKISFTGSGEIGRQIMREGADTLKRVSLELGGKSPNIFFADADFEQAVEGALFGVFINQGEVCSAGSRVLVQKPIYKKMLDAMVERARMIKLGPGIDPQTKMGPLMIGERLLRAADDLLRRRQQLPHRPRGDLRSGHVGHPLRQGGGCLPDRQRQPLRPRRGAVEPRRLQGAPSHQEAAGRDRMGQSHAAGDGRGALGRIQTIRFRTRARLLRSGRIPRGEAGLHQPRRKTDRLVRLVPEPRESSEE